MVLNGDKWREKISQSNKGVDKSVDQTTIIGEKIGDITGDKYLSPLIISL